MAFMRFTETGLFDKKHTSLESIWEDAQNPRREIRDTLIKLNIQPPKFLDSKQKTDD